MERKRVNYGNGNDSLTRYHVVTTFEEHGALSVSKLDRLVRERYPRCQTHVLKRIVRDLLEEDKLRVCINPKGRPPEGYTDTGYFLRTMKPVLVERGVLDSKEPDDLHDLLDDFETEHPTATASGYGKI
jgi:hypothetical protein